MTMSEYQAVMGELGNVRADVKELTAEMADLCVEFGRHCAAEEAMAKQRRQAPAWLSTAAAWVAAGIALAALFVR